MKFYAKWYVGLTFNSFSITRGRGAKFLCVKEIKLMWNGRNGYPIKSTRVTFLGYQNSHKRHKQAHAYNFWCWRNLKMILFYKKIVWSCRTWCSHPLLLKNQWWGEMNGCGDFRPITHDAEGIWRWFFFIKWLSRSRRCDGVGGDHKCAALFRRKSENGDFFSPPANFFRHEKINS